MIRFLLTRGRDYTIKQVQKARFASAAGIMNYDSLLRAYWLRPATYIFTDLDRLSFWDLESVSHLYVKMKAAGFQVLNDPARVKTRYPLLRALHAAGLNDFNVYRMDEIDHVNRFPVFLKRIHGHGEPVSDLIQNSKELKKTAEEIIAGGVPAENLLAIEFVGEPVAPGIYRKLSAFRIGDSIFQHVSVHDTHWLVKHGKLGIAGEKLYREERTLLETNPFKEHLKKVFDLANIEYGRADFGFYKGRLQIYEINTNPCVDAPSTHPSPIREESIRLSWQKYLDTLALVDSKDTGSLLIAREKNLRRQARKNFFTRSRIAP